MLFYLGLTNYDNCNFFISSKLNVLLTTCFEQILYLYVILAVYSAFRDY